MDTIQVNKTYCCCEWFIRQSTQRHTTFSSHTKKDYSKSLPAATVQQLPAQVIVVVVVVVIIVKE